jgi:hypothetical protein
MDSGSPVPIAGLVPALPHGINSWAEGRRKPGGVLTTGITASFVTKMRR